MKEKVVSVLFFLTLFSVYAEPQEDIKSPDEKVCFKAEHKNNDYEEYNFEEEEDGIEFLDDLADDAQTMDHAKQEVAINYETIKLGLGLLWNQYIASSYNDFVEFVMSYTVRNSCKVNNEEPPKS